MRYISSKEITFGNGAGEYPPGTVVTDTIFELGKCTGVGYNNQLYTKSDGYTLGTNYFQTGGVMAPFQGGQTAVFYFENAIQIG